MKEVKPKLKNKGMKKNKEKTMNHKKNIERVKASITRKWLRDWVRHRIMIAR